MLTNICRIFRSPFMCPDGPDNVDCAKIILCDVRLCTLHNFMSASVNSSTQLRNVNNSTFSVLMTLTSLKSSCTLQTLILLLYLFLLCNYSPSSISHGWKSSPHKQRIIHSTCFHLNEKNSSLQRCIRQFEVRIL